MEKCNHLKGARRILAIVGMALGGVILAGCMALLLGFVVMWLWNWLMPEIFSLPVITFWQAWGLVFLSHILFKSFPHHNPPNHDDRWKKRLHEKMLCDKKPTQEPAGDTPATEAH